MSGPPLSLKLTRGHVSLARSYRNSQSEWGDREGLLIELSTARTSSVVGRGECTPLPKYSREALADSLHALTPLASGPARSIEQWWDYVNSSRLPPSAEFGLASALLQTAHVGPAAPAPPSAEWIDWQDLPEQLSCLRSDAPVLKLKVGIDWPAERGLLTALRGRSMRLRLDANRSLSPVQLLELGSLGLPLEFVEEPSRLSVLGPPRALPVPLALDESLWLEPELSEAWLSAGQVTALVLKPMVLGYRATLHWARRARLSAARCVLSHALDGSVAMNAYRALCPALCTTDLCTTDPHNSPQVMGLGQHAGLQLWSREALELPFPALNAADLS